MEDSRTVSYTSPQKQEATFKKLAVHKRSPGVDFTGGKRKKGPRMEASKSSGKDRSNKKRSVSKHRRQTHSLDFYNASGVKDKSPAK